MLKQISVAFSEEELKEIDRLALLENRSRRGQIRYMIVSILSTKDKDTPDEPKINKKIPKF